ncbi:YhcN/YlaJ family sporulation lipoprotein [Bacillus kwashiorkori]|uniref:YhcN/YlaJ family sporulation lipoprotein n=1 Tax=Bacillus kwashiorkori TaxID=1522318 RepID=UPI000781F99F|nr:YhcN/YlaJ family sporulation lipoprotein [Bacillus kwashiorkori]
MKGKKLLYTIQICLLLFITACASKDDTEVSRNALIKTTNPPAEAVDNHPKQAGIVKEIKDTVLSFNEIYDTAIIKGEKETIVTYKVRQLQRFRMKKIEKNVKEKLEKKFPDEQFIISSDFKIFLETIRLQEKIRNNTLSEKKIENQLKKIITLSKEQT